MQLFTILGLVLNLIGALLIFCSSLKANYDEKLNTIIMNVPDANDSKSSKTLTSKLSFSKSQWGIILLIIGFVFQLIPLIF